MAALWSDQWIEGCLSSSEQLAAAYKAADADGDGIVKGSEAVAFFRGSGMPDASLSYIWRSASKDSFVLGTQDELRVALGLLLEARKGCIPFQSAVRIDGEVGKKAAATTIANLQQDRNIMLSNLSPRQSQQYMQLFSRLTAEDCEYIPAHDVKRFLSSSGLQDSVIATLLHAAAGEDDEVDVGQFEVAMHITHATMEEAKRLIAAGLGSSPTNKRTGNRTVSAGRGSGGSSSKPPSFSAPDRARLLAREFPQLVRSVEQEGPETRVQLHHDALRMLLKDIGGEIVRLSNDGLTDGVIDGSPAVIPPVNLDAVVRCLGKLRGVEEAVRLALPPPPVPPRANRHSRSTSGGFSEFTPKRAVPLLPSDRTDSQGSGRPSIVGQSSVQFSGAAMQSDEPHDPFIALFTSKVMQKVVKANSVEIAADVSPASLLPSETISSLPSTSMQDLATSNSASAEPASTRSTAEVPPRTSHWAAFSNDDTASSTTASMDLAAAAAATAAAATAVAAAVAHKEAGGTRVPLATLQSPQSVSSAALPLSAGSSGAWEGYAVPPAAPVGPAGPVVGAGAGPSADSLPIAGSAAAAAGASGMSATRSLLSASSSSVAGMPDTDPPQRSTSKVKELVAAFDRQPDTGSPLSPTSSKQLSPTLAKQLSNASSGHGSPVMDAAAAASAPEAATAVPANVQVAANGVPLGAGSSSGQGIDVEGVAVSSAVPPDTVQTQAASAQGAKNDVQTVPYQSKRETTPTAMSAEAHSDQGNLVTYYSAASGSDAITPVEELTTVSSTGAALLPQASAFAPVLSAGVPAAANTSLAVEDPWAPAAANGTAKPAAPESAAVQSGATATAEPAATGVTADDPWGVAAAPSVPSEPALIVADNKAIASMDAWGPSTVPSASLGPSQPDDDLWGPANTTPVVLDGSQVPPDSWGTAQAPIKSSGAARTPAASSGVAQAPPDLWGPSSAPADPLGPPQPLGGSVGPSQPSTDLWGSSPPPADTLGPSQQTAGSLGPSQPSTDMWGPSMPSSDTWGPSQARNNLCGASQPPADLWGPPHVPAVNTPASTAAMEGNVATGYSMNGTDWAAFVDPATVQVAPDEAVQPKATKASEGTDSPLFTQASLAGIVAVAAAATAAEVAAVVHREPSMNSPSHRRSTSVPTPRAGTPSADAAAFDQAFALEGISSQPPPQPLSLLSQQGSVSVAGVSPQLRSSSATLAATTATATMSLQQSISAAGSAGPGTPVTARHDTLWDATPFQPTSPETGTGSNGGPLGTGSPTVPAAADPWAAAPLPASDPWAPAIAAPDVAAGGWAGFDQTPLAADPWQTSAGALLGSPSRPHDAPARGTSLFDTGSSWNSSEQLGIDSQPSTATQAGVSPRQRQLPSVPEQHAPATASWLPMPVDSRGRCVKVYEDKYAARGGASKADVGGFVKHAKLPHAVVEDVWRVCASPGSQMLTCDQFCLMMLCIQQVSGGYSLPPSFAPSEIQRLLALQGPAGTGATQSPGVGAAPSTDLSPAMQDLLGLGFSLEQAQRAMELHQGDMEAAATWLISQNSVDRTTSAISAAAGGSFNGYGSTSAPLQAETGAPAQRHGRHHSFAAGKSTLLMATGSERAEFTFANVFVSYKKDMSAPFIAVTLRDANGVDMERTQETPPGMYNARTHVLQLGHSLTLQTPLTSVTSGSVVFIEVRHYKTKEKKVSTAAWSFLEATDFMDFNDLTPKIKLGSLLLPLYQKPVDITRTKLKRVNPKAKELTLSIGVVHEAAQ